MPDETIQRSASQILVCSSISDDSWHNLAGPNAFESWHFDALSDDGREAVVIAFYDNYVLSPRFQSNTNVPANVIHSGKHRFPAVSFVYSVDGRPVFNSINEYVEGDFHFGKDNGCVVAGSSFRFDSAAYGEGFFVTVDVRTAGGRRIRAEMEWLLIESDLMPPDGTRTPGMWNLVAPRADVSGKIMLIGRRGKVRRTVQFRGTGYHDQISSENVHYRELASRMWGRAHFIDSTVVFERHGGVQDHAAAGKVFLIRDGKIHESDAACVASDYKHDRWGLNIPRRISYMSDDQIELRIKPTATIRSGFSEAKMLGEITLGLRDDKPRKTIGMVEFVDPRRMGNRLSRWITDLRIGRNGKAPVF
ncbi:MAG: hypothetical protein IPI64_09415 [Chloracidobacterium sp.]|nr:hypothetical protein [Chloracidobacterium sp.]